MVFPLEFSLDFVLYWNIGVHWHCKSTAILISWGGRQRIDTVAFVWADIVSRCTTQFKWCSSHIVSSHKISLMFNTAMSTYIKSYAIFIVMIATSLWRAREDFRAVGSITHKHQSRNGAQSNIFTTIGLTISQWARTSKDPMHTKCRPNELKVKSFEIQCL